MLDMPDHTALALECIARADHLTVKIGTLFADPEPDSATINQYARQRASNNKRAEVHALLAIGQKLDDLARVVEVPR